MKIFEKDGWIHLQLMDLTTKEMLMDFSVGKDFFNELRDHMIKHLKAFKMPEEEKEPDVEAFLTDMADNVEPKTHCCECTPGKHYEPHGVHIQYPNCDCHPSSFILKRNE